MWRGHARPTAAEAAIRGFFGISHNILSMLHLQDIERIPVGLCDCAASTDPHHSRQELECVPGVRLSERTEDAQIPTQPLLKRSHRPGSTDTPAWYLGSIWSSPCRPRHFHPPRVQLHKLNDADLSGKQPCGTPHTASWPLWHSNRDLANRVQAEIVAQCSRYTLHLQVVYTRTVLYNDP